MIRLREVDYNAVFLPYTSDGRSTSVLQVHVSCIAGYSRARHHSPRRQTCEFSLRSSQGCRDPGRPRPGLCECSAISVETWNRSVIIFQAHGHGTAHALWEMPAHSANKRIPTWSATTDGRIQCGVCQEEAKGCANAEWVDV